MSDHVLRAGTTATDDYALAVSPETAGWTHSGLRVLHLPPGGSFTLATGHSEVVLLSLGGGADVVVDDDARFSLEGRGSVFDGPSDVVYAPRDSTLSLTSAEGGRFALCSAVCESHLAPAYLPKAEVPMELRGAGQASRKVHNFGVPGVLEAVRDGDILPVDLAANAASLGADVLVAHNADELETSLREARKSTLTTVIHVETDPTVPAPDSPAWWDVPVAEVSALDSTRTARAMYDEHKRTQRPLITPTRTNDKDEP